MVNGLKVIQYIKEVKLQQAINTAKSQLVPFAKTNVILMNNLVLKNEDYLKDHESNRLHRP